MTIANDTADLSFESALRELEAIVKRMETGDAELDKAIADYERGMTLKSFCEKKLQDARLKVEKIVQAGAATAPFHTEE